MGHKKRFIHSKIKNQEQIREMENSGLGWIAKRIFTKDYDQTFFDEIQGKKISLNKDSEIVIFTASKIVTMNPMQPSADAVAVHDSRIYAIGSFEKVHSIAEHSGMKYTICQKFQDSIILPGFIESHSHFTEMAVYFQFDYIGPFEHIDRQGELVSGYRSKEEIISQLKSISANSDNTVFAWGFDSTMIEDDFKFLTVSDLDRASRDKPIIVVDSTGHGIYVNSAVLESVGFNSNTEIDGVEKDDNGNPTGILKELKAIAPVYEKFLKLDESFFERGFKVASDYCVSMGVTTVSDMAFGLTAGALKCLAKATSDVSFPIRVATYILHEVADMHGGPEAFLNFQERLKKSGNINFTVNGVKFFIDGSLQINTAFMKWPYYYFTENNGILNIEFDELYSQLKKYFEAGINCSIHTNGSGAIELALTAIKHIKRYLNDREHIFRLEHCQTVSETQLEQIAKYNVLPNFYALNLHYWGDYHYENSMGPILTEQMNPLRSALRHNIPFALHSDCPVVQMEPLKSIWTAVNRKSLSGKILGCEETVSVYEALKAHTINAAKILGEGDLKGSLEVGKLADMVVLEKNPLECSHDEIRNIQILGTIKGGEIC